MSPLPTVFLQANLPVATPYCAGAHLWGAALPRFATSRPVEALDLPGFANGPRLPADAGLDVLTNHAAEHLRGKSTPRSHVVAHDLAGLVGLQLAMDHPELLASLTIVCSTWAAPSGDSLENLTFDQPPPPLWGRASQAWALERLCHSHMAIDGALLDKAAAAAQGEAHQSAVTLFANSAARMHFIASATRTKFRFFQRARGEGIAVPVQVLAGMNDPLASPDYHLELFRIIAAKQRRAHFHLINRCGALPFLEQPEAFYRVIYAFHDGLALEEKGSER
jgi:2-hydroxy-6-oxonona-2,4-dienedioate hydrolase